MSDEFRAEGEILLVESDQSVRTEISDSLTKAGFQVTQATDGAHALKVMDRKTWKWTPRFVIIDTVLPGLSSFELLRRLNEKFEKKDTLLVMMSKYKAPEDEAEAATAGASGFVLKPLTVDNLKAIYERVQEKKLKLERSTQGFLVNQ